MFYKNEFCDTCFGKTSASVLFDHFLERGSVYYYEASFLQNDNALAKVFFFIPLYEINSLWKITYINRLKK